MNYRKLELKDKVLSLAEWPFLRRGDWARAAAIGRVLPGQVRWRGGAAVCGPPLNLALRPDQAWFLAAYRDAVACVRDGDFEFLQDTSGAELIARSRDFQVRLRRPEEITILRSVAIRGLYRFRLPGPTLVIDVGANVGMASLWFAATQDSVVVAYEPMPAAVELAKANFALNPALASRIELRPFGLSDKNDRFSVEFDPDWLWSSSTVGGELIGASSGPRKTCEIEVRRASDELRPLVERHADRQLVLKIDCEGAEYEIMPDLEQAGLLQRARVVSLEWHRMRPDHDPQRLMDQLLRLGFTVLAESPLSRPEGQFYATKG